jgi:hypothetical protein
LWNVAQRTESLLPYVPQAVWGIPGELWRAAPPVYVLAVAGATYLLAVVLAGWKPKRSVSIAVGVFTGIVTITHLLWGGALLAAT